MAKEGEEFVFPQFKGDVIANDGSSFSKPFFDKANKDLAKRNTLVLSLFSKKYPSSYLEDASQKDRRDHFNVREWSLIAICLNEDGDEEEYLLIHSLYQDEGLLLDKSFTIKAQFYRGFKIKEFDEIEDGDYFLSSIGYEKNEFEPIIDSYIITEDDEEEYLAIEVKRPDFVANKKRKPINLGGNEFIIDEEMEEDEDEDKIIEVEKPAFSAYSNKKPRNLDANRNNYKKKNKPQPVVKTLEKKEEPEKEVDIEVERPSFVPSNNKKIKTIVIESDKKKKVEPTKIVKKAEEKKPPVEKEVSIQIEKPSFVPTSNKKIRNLNNKNRTEDVQVVEYIPLEEKKKEKRIVEEKPIEKKEETKQYSSIDIIKLKPRVFKGERSAINSSSFPNDAPFIQKAKEIIEKISSIRISSTCVFSPSLWKDDDERFSLFSHFDHSKWDIICLTLDKDDNILYILLNGKERNGLSSLMSLKHNEAHIVMISSNGVCLDDRALPFMDYQTLSKIIYG